MPKRKPQALSKPGDKPKPLGQPKKFAPFSARDSRSIESAFQRLAEEEKSGGNKEDSTGDISEARGNGDTIRDGTQNNTSINNAARKERGGPVKVPVNEDFLFDVDIDQRELAATFWLGKLRNVSRTKFTLKE